MSAIERFKRGKSQKSKKPEEDKHFDPAPRQIVIAESEVKEGELEVLQRHQDSVKQLLEELSGGEEGFVVKSDEDYLFAGELLKHANNQLSVLDTRKKLVTKPLNDALKGFREWYLPPIKAWGSAVALLKEKMGAWDLLQAQRAEKAARQIAAASSKGDYDAAHEASTQLVEAPKVAGVSTKLVWVLDEERVDLQKVDRKYLALDVRAVTEYIKSFDKARPKDLPGLPFKRVSSITASKRG